MHLWLELKPSMEKTWTDYSEDVELRLLAKSTWQREGKLTLVLMGG